MDKNTDDISRQVFSAAHARIGRSVVFFAPSRANERANSVSTGTLIRTPRGRFVVLTAGHCVDEVGTRPHTLGYFNCLGAVDDPFEQTIGGPPGVDVAALVLKSHVPPFVAPFAVESGRVASSDDVAISEMQWCVVAGYPAATVSNEREGTVIHQMFGGVSYACIVEGTDSRRRYRIAWAEGVVQYAAPHTGIAVGSTEILPEPHGISGGALWRVTGGTPKEQVWSVDTRGHIIGVATAFLPESRVELAESVAVWGDWFRDVVRTVDR